MWVIFPGARALEAGVGSGGLTTARCVPSGPRAPVHSIERREDFAEVARENVETYFGGPHPAWDLSLGDFQDLAPTLSPGEPAADRVVLDMLAPWECVDAAAEGSSPRRLPRQRRHGHPALPHGRGPARPRRVHRAVRLGELGRPGHSRVSPCAPSTGCNAHTGFLLTARRTAHGTQALTRVTRPAPGSRLEEELNHPDNEGFGGSDAEWGPQDVGERGVAPRKLKRALRDIRQGRDR